ncbi:lipase [Rhodococcus rhodnii]|nr:lipase family protein [Rhodococcus rhodnii]TXG91489.1 lipase [Rhodococcus rhodnii]
MRPSTRSLRASRARFAVAAAALAAAALLTVPTASAAPVQPVADGDPFYYGGAESSTPDGAVLGVRPVAAPAFPGASAWQVRYKSTDSAGAPIAAMTTVLTPPGGGAKPLVSYQPFVNSLGMQCAPSHSVATGGLQETPLLAGMLARGWAVAVPDHLGPTSAYGAAQLGGRLVLDGIRAVRDVPEAAAGGPVAMAGYSGGAMATAWAASLAPEHAPDLPLVGAAVGGTPVDLGELADRLGGTPSPAFGLGFAAAIGLEREYPTRSPLGDVLNPDGLALRDRMANLCTDDILAAGSGRSIDELTTRPGIFDDPEVRSVMNENSVTFAPPPRIPLYVWHGDADPLVTIGPVRDAVGKFCAGGTPVRFDSFPGADHGTAIVAGGPAAFGYLGDRIAGVPAPSTC